MFNWFKKKKKNDWRVVNKFWGGDSYIEELVEYPTNSRMVDLSVVNGNVGHGMKGFYYEDKWWSDDYSPISGSVFKGIPKGITVAAWREL